jgi:spermidine synthase
MDPSSSNRYLPWLLVIFAGSGCAALIYEVVWLQLLQLVIGSNGISLGLLLGTFMGGMCLGSFLLPRVIPAGMHPLRVWALLELGIGVIALATSNGMPVIADLYTNHLGHGVMMRALLAAACLLPPTVLMGATLPAIARWIEATPAGVSWMGLLYASNIGGSVLGCLAAGFYLLRVYDMPTAVYTAAALNLAAAAIAFLLAALSSHRILPQDPTSLRCGRLPHHFPVYVAIALSGLCALGAEVVWTRLLSLLLGATVYTFSIILAVFLVGLGIGSGIGAFIARRFPRRMRPLGICQMLAAVSAAWAAFIIAHSLPYWPINPSLATGAWGPWHLFQLDLLRAAWVLFPAATLWGASFPLALAAVATEGEDPGRMVGAVYAANTVGAIVGSLLFSLVIIPQVGTQWAQRLLILISGASALIVWAPELMSIRANEHKDQEPEPASAWFRFGALLVPAVIVLLSLTVSQVPWLMVAWGRFSATWQSYTVPGIVSESQVPVDPSASERRYCTYVGEGMNVSVAVTKSTSGSRYFHGAGKVQASSDPQDMRLQRMLGHLSVLARKDPEETRDVLVVACGAGVTAGSFVPYPDIKNIVICDIEPLVPKVVTPMFGQENYHIVDGIDKENPHMVNGKTVRVVYDDGRHYIRTLPKDAKFDIITSDPIDPWVKGSAALNTVEYYQMCRDHLKPGGVMSLWIPLYESNTETAKSVIGTFFNVFPNGLLFSNDNGTGGYDAVLLGQIEPTQINLDRLQRLLDSDSYRQVKESLTAVGFGKGAGSTTNGPLSRTVAMQLLATFAGQAQSLKPWMMGAQINTDRNLRLQYLAGMWYNSYMATTILEGILHYYRFPENIFIGAPDTLQAMKQALTEAGRGKQP